MKILVTNDDGVTAPGMWALVEELQKIADVFVVAPDREKSGVGTSITLHQPLRVRNIDPLINGIPTYAVEGTPGDSVILALRMLIKEKIDLVVSGINEGSNLGNDVLISGTVGAAFQAYFYMINAIAISVASFTDLHFEAAANIASILSQQINSGNLGERVLLNVNVPNLPQNKIKGIEFTRLGERDLSDSSRNGYVEVGHDGKRHYYWFKHGAPKWTQGEGTDIWALEQDKISITPLHSDVTNHEQSIQLQALSTALMESLRASSPA